MLLWSFWPGPEGGAERQCRKLLQATAGRNVQYIVFTSRFASKALPDEIDNGVRIFRFGFLTPWENKIRSKINSFVISALSRQFRGDIAERWAWNLVFWLTLPMRWVSRLIFILALKQWFSQNQKSVDVLHVHETGWLSGVGAWIGGKYQIPVLAKTSSFPALPKLGYDVPLRGAWHKWRQYCTFIAQHHGLAQEMVSAGIPKQRIFIVPNGVEIPESTAQPEKDGPVLFVGNFSQGAHWKAFDILIQAWSIVHQQFPNTELHLIGAGNATHWKSFAAEIGCGQSIIFYGAIPDPHLHYRHSCLFILPSRIEGISNALLEAQSYGLPCVVSDIPGNRVIVEDGVNGLVVPVDNARELADATIRLLEDSELRTRLGRAAREKIAQEFSFQTVGEKLTGLYGAVSLQYRDFRK